MFENENPHSAENTESSESLGDALRKTAELTGKASIDREWDEKTIRKRSETTLAAAKESRSQRQVTGKTLTLQDILTYGADSRRLQAIDLIALSKQKGGIDKLDDVTKQQLATVQMEVAQIELLQRALDSYFAMVQRYEAAQTELKTDADPSRHAAVTTQLAIVRALAEKRVDLAHQFVSSTSDKEKMNLRTSILDVEQKLITTLASTQKVDSSETTPAQLALLDVIEKKYKHNLDSMNQLATKGETTFAKELFKRVENTKKEIENRYAKSLSEGHRAVWESGDKKVPDDFRRKTIEEIYPGGIPKYTIDVAMLRFSKSSAQHDIQHLQKQNGKALSYLLEVNAAQGSYQVSQAELSANRHHFDQSYRIDESRPGSRTPGRQASPEQRAKYDERLSKSGEGSLQSLTDHLDLVDKGVMKEDTIKKLEETWNTDGRLFVGWLADKIVQWEAAVIPTAFLKGKAKEYLMGGMYDALGWPRRPDGALKDWNELNADEKKEMKGKQKNVLDSIRKFRGFDPESKEQKRPDPLEKVKKTAQAADILIKNKEKWPAAADLAEGELPEDSYLKEEITPDNVEALVKQHGIRIVSLSCHRQLQQNWQQYSTEYGTFLNEVHGVINVHVDWARIMNEFGDKQLKMGAILVGLLALAGIAGGLLISAAGMALSRLPSVVRGTGNALSKSARLLRVGGSRLAVGAGAAVTAFEIYRIASIQPLPEVEAVDEVYRFLEEHRSKPEAERVGLRSFGLGGEIPLLNKDLDYFLPVLEKRREALRIKQIAEAIAADSPDKPDVVEKCKQLAERATALNADFFKIFRIGEPGKEMGKDLFKNTSVNREAFMEIYAEALQRRQDSGKRSLELAAFFSKDKSTPESKNQNAQLVQLRTDFMALLTQIGFLKKDLPEL